MNDWTNIVGGFFYVKNILHIQGFRPIIHK